MAFKLIKSNPLYGKEGTLINNSLHKQLPDRHKELFIKADNNSRTNAHKQFEDGIREAMEQIQAVRAGREIQGDRFHQNPRIQQVYFGGIPDNGENIHPQRVQFNLEEVEDEDDDDDDHGWDLMEEDFEEEDDEEDF